MNEIKQKIEKFVDDAVNKKDYATIDLLWIFSHTSMAGNWSEEKIKLLKEMTKKNCRRNLEVKYGSDIMKEKMETFYDFLNEISPPITAPNTTQNTAFRDILLSINEILENKTSEIIIQNTKDRLEKSSDLERKILSFVLGYIPIKTQESLEESEKKRKMYSFHKNKYEALYEDGFYIKEDENGNIIYYEIYTEKWMFIFNEYFNEELKGKEYKTNWNQKITTLPITNSRSPEKYSFNDFGDILVRLGIGYRTIHISTKAFINRTGADVSPHDICIIPSFIYENIKNYKEQLIEIDMEKINEIIKEKNKAWKFGEYEEREIINEVLEEDIEQSIISNPEILENGLKLIGNQFPTEVGIIDILCKDKNDNYVVVELKKDKTSDKVVGQIQRYISWVSENLAKENLVRGIIVMKDYDKSLEYAVKGSKYKIEIKSFGKNPPIEENIKYCDKCGKPNMKNAKHCVKCGKEFWM